MRKIIIFLSAILCRLLFSSSVSADLRSDATQSNDPNALVKYINTTAAGKNIPIKKVTNTEDNNYTVFILKKKPKVASLAQRTKFAKNIQSIMNETPQNFQRNGIAFYEGNSDGANFIIAFDKSKVTSNYRHAVQFSKLGSLGAGTTASYFEPFFAKDDTTNSSKSSRSTQRPKNNDGETLIGQIQNVTE